MKSNVTFLVGENGSGKSTLIEGIAEACGFNLEGEAAITALPSMRIVRT